MHYSYNTKGTCSVKIDYDIIDGKVSNVSFLGGCNGNLQGISALVEGMTPEQVVSKLKGIKCGFKQTSCPDQLATAIETAIGGNGK